MIVCGVLLASAMILPQTCSRNQDDPNANAAQMNNTVVATVGQNNITVGQIDAQYKQGASQYESMGMTLTPDLEFLLFSTSLRNSIDTALMGELAKRKALSLDDVSVLSVFEKQIDAQIDQAKMTLALQKKVPDNATPAQIDAAFKEMTGKTIAEMKTEAVAEMKKGLADQATRQNMVMAAVPTLLREAYASQAQVNEAELKKSYDQFVMEAIPFNDLKKSLSEREEAADKAYDELEGGKAFAEVKKQYAPSAPTTPVTLPYTLVEGSPELKGLLNLKPGEVAEPVLREGSPVIYRLTKVTNSLPADFEKNKAQLLESRRASIADITLRKDLEELKKATPVTWKDDILKLVYEVATVPVDESNAARREKYLALAEELSNTSLKSALNTSDKIRSQGAFIALQQAYDLSTPAQQKELGEQMAEAQLDVLEYSESLSLRMSLAQYYFDISDGDSLTEQLETAADNNTSFDPTGQQNYVTVTNFLKKSVDAKKITDEQRKKVQAKLDRWLKDKAEFVKEEEEARKEREAVQKELDEADKKEAEKAKKDEEEAKKKAGTAPPTKPK